MEMKDKVAIITGGGTGIGRSTCLKMAERGAKIALNYLNSEKEALLTAREIQTIGAEVLLLQADVSNDNEVKEMVHQVISRFGTVHYLVNNASITKQIELSDLDAVSDEVWEQLMNVNVKGMFYCARAVTPYMLRNKGCSILNVGSIAGITGSGSSLPYAVSKAAVHGLTKSLAHGLAPDIRVNCIAPAAVDTRWWMGEEEKMMRLSGHLPLQRISTPEDIAEFICAILMQESMTGQIISPNNGMDI
ncbi:MAG: short-chain dehydrogenase/reductase [Herbinix sp.]|jgi:3-oxoacyl-[acyl-carrier protein] reductase|nr:short-chain dehydrogenase/reductase [Herbinix sp.]